MFTLGIKVPQPLTADAYTVGSGTHVSSDAKDFSAYQVQARKRPEWMDDQFKNAEALMGGPLESRFVFHGLSAILHDLFSTRLTHEQIDEEKEFLQTFHAGNIPFSFDEKMLRRVVDECKGIAPIRIKALKDGATFFLGEPIIQIEGENGFGELAGYYESKLLQVWATSERATLMRHWLDYNKALVKECTSAYLDDPTILFLAQLQTHDFGDRAGSCPQESERLGLAQLTSHFGTDTCAAAYIAWKLNGKKPVGSSIKALAHRIVMGFPKEFQAYEALFNSEPAAFTSHVGDTNNFFRAVDNYLLPLAKKAASTGGVIVARPDSGDPTEQLLYVFNAAVDAGMFNIVHTGKKYRGMTNLKSIEGDGMQFKTVIDINNTLLENKFSPIHCGIYGIGGFVRNIIQRDNTGMTMKLCAVGSSHRPTMKFSHTPGKGSIPGLAKIVREPGQPTVRSIDEPGQDELVMAFDGTLGEVYQHTESFDTVRQRVLNDFHKFPVPNPENTCSAKIKALKKALHHEFVD